MGGYKWHCWIFRYVLSSQLDTLSVAVACILIRTSEPNTVSEVHLTVSSKRFHYDAKLNEIKAASYNRLGLEFEKIIYLTFVTFRHLDPFLRSGKDMKDSTQLSPRYRENLNRSYTRESTTRQKIRYVSWTRTIYVNIFIQ